MKLETVGVILSVVSCFIAVGGVLIYIGRSLGTLNRIDESQREMRMDIMNHDLAIIRIDKELTEVKTRQADCENCP